MMTTKTIAGAFIVEREIRIDAPRENVFPLISTRDGLVQWMPVTDLEPRAGGRIQFTFAPESGGTHTATGEITAFDPPSRIAFTWNSTHDGAGAVQTEVSIELIPEGGATLVRLTHTGFVDDEKTGNYSEGWGYFLERLKDRAEGKDPGDDRSSIAARRRDAVRELLSEEIALKDHVERVAAMRRTLPLGPPIVAEYPLHGQNGKAATLAELFGDKDELLVYHLMFAPEDDAPCRMCAMWVDGFNAIAPHVRQRAEFVVIAKAPIDKLESYAKKRGWDTIRLFSSYGTDFQGDFNAEDDEGDQLAVISAFRRENGMIYHFYQKSANLDDNNYRGIDLLSPVWNLLDLLPSGRGDWYPSNSY
jgi:predicted dithiol-disulfide oxidoreductase (DUF899 family)/uncharacterized protein YndB with AHSA1/START domain